MGLVWSVIEPEEMRLASRDVCDDETWANTVTNRSSCSVQERLSLLAWEIFPFESISLLKRERSGKKLEFAKHDSVCIFEKDEREHLPPLPPLPIQNEDILQFSNEQDDEFPTELSQPQKQYQHQLLLSKYQTAFLEDSDDSSNDSDESPSASLDW